MDSKEAVYNMTLEQFRDTFDKWSEPYFEALRKQEELITHIEFKIKEIREFINCNNLYYPRVKERD